VDQASFAGNIDYQALFAALLMVLILTAAFLIFCYTPLPLETSKTSHSVQLAKWLRVAGMVRPSKRMSRLAR
jgi:hypothetical protein